jgi:hypothetical protein
VISLQYSYSTHTRLKIVQYRFITQNTACNRDKISICHILIIEKHQDITRQHLLVLVDKHE